MVQTCNAWNFCTSAIGCSSEDGTATVERVSHSCTTVTYLARTSHKDWLMAGPVVADLGRCAQRTLWHAHLTTEEC